MCWIRKCSILLTLADTHTHTHIVWLLWLPKPLCASDAGCCIFCSSDIWAAARLLCVDHLSACVTQPAVRSVAKGCGLWSQTAGVECEPTRLTELGYTLNEVISLRRRAWESYDVGVMKPRLSDFISSPLKPLRAMIVLIVVIIIRVSATRHRPVWLGRRARDWSQGLAWVFGLKPQCWVQARRAVIPANYSQGLHQGSHRQAITHT